MTSEQKSETSLCDSWGTSERVCPPVCPQPEEALEGRASPGSGHILPSSRGHELPGSPGQNL